MCFACTYTLSLPSTAAQCVNKCLEIKRREKLNKGKSENEILNNKNRMKQKNLYEIEYQIDYSKRLTHKYCVWHDTTVCARVHVCVCVRTLQCMAHPYTSTTRHINRTKVHLFPHTHTHTEPSVTHAHTIVENCNFIAQIRNVAYTYYGEKTENVKNVYGRQVGGHVDWRERDDSSNVPARIGQKRNSKLNLESSEPTKYKKNVLRCMHACIHTAVYVCYTPWPSTNF